MLSLIFISLILSSHSVLGYTSNLPISYEGRGILQKIGNDTNPGNSTWAPPAPSVQPYSKGCNLPGFNQAKAELSSAEQQYLDLKEKNYQDWKQLEAAGKYNGTWIEYAKENLLASPEVGKVRQIHEQYGGLVQYCYPAPLAGSSTSPTPPVISGSTIEAHSSSSIGTVNATAPYIANSMSSTKSTDVLMEIEPQTSIPKWVKNNAKWWAADEIGDSDFISGIQYVASQKIINLYQPLTISNASSSGLPSWVKGLAGSWADGKISTDYFATTIQYLVNQNVIKISS